MIATLRRKGLSPIEWPMVGKAVAMIVESRFCMNIAHATIRLMTSWRVRGVICATVDDEFDSRSSGQNRAEPGGKKDDTAQFSAAGRAILREEK